MPIAATFDAAGPDEALQVLAAAFASGTEVAAALQAVSRTPGFAALAEDIGSSVPELVRLMDPAHGEAAWIVLESLQLVLYGPSRAA